MIHAVQNSGARSGDPRTAMEWNGTTGWTEVNDLNH